MVPPLLMGLLWLPSWLYYLFNPLNVSAPCVPSPLYAETYSKASCREPMFFRCPLASFIGLPEALQHRLAGAGPENVVCCQGKSMSNMTLGNRVSVWMARTYHGSVQSSVLFSCSG